MADRRLSPPMPVSPISSALFIFFLQGVGDGSQPLMSQFYGAGEEKSLKQTKTLAYEFSMILAVISAILIYLLRGKIGLLFGSSAEVNAGVIKVMPIFLVSVPFDAITRVSTAAFYATEKKCAVLCSDIYRTHHHAGVDTDAAAGVWRSNHDLVEHRICKGHYRISKHCAVR